MSDDNTTPADDDAQQEEARIEAGLQALQGLALQTAATVLLTVSVAALVVLAVDLILALTLGPFVANQSPTPAPLLGSAASVCALAALGCMLRARRDLRAIKEG